MTTKAVRCTASGQERSWTSAAWSASEVVCPDCGARGDLCWVRGTDLPLRAKTRAHKPPPGVTPSPYGFNGLAGDAAPGAALPRR